MARARKSRWAISSALGLTFRRKSPVVRFPAGPLVVAYPNRSHVWTRQAGWAYDVAARNGLAHIQLFGFVLGLDRAYQGRAHFFANS